MTEFFDTHAHLDFPDYAEDLEAVVERATAAGITRIVTIGTTLEGSTRAVAIAEHFPSVFAAVGVHPGHMDESPDEIRPALRDLARHPKVVAIGETGLDYYQMEERKGGRTVADMEWQRERFRIHIRAARQVGKPLIIHTRAASADTLAILKEEGEDGSPGCAGGVFHCFTETAEVARAALDIGYFISFSGILTFKSAQELRDVASFVPLDRLLIETDSPYLAPVPHRGKLNNPSYVPLVAQQLALLRGLPVHEIAELTSRNFERLFALGERAEII